MKKPQRLLELQETDSHIDQLEAKKETLPEKSAYEEAAAELEELQRDVARKMKDHEGEDKRQRKLEGELGRLDEKVKGEESKLYEGKIQNPKELVSLQDEIKMLQRERDGLETEYLEALEHAEGLGRELGTLRERESEVARATEKAQKAYDGALDKLERELAGLRDKRDQIGVGIPPEVSRRYERLRKERGGVAVTTVKDGVCQGCGLEISTEEEDLMYKEDRIWRCEHCKRILVR